MLKNAGKCHGFSLIELMIVIAIIGILAAIAVPQFNAYRVRAYNSLALSDLKVASLAQEAYYVVNLTYCATTTTLKGVTYGFTTESNNVYFDILAANNTTYSMVTWNTLGSLSFVIRGPGGTPSTF